MVLPRVVRQRSDRAVWGVLPRSYQARCRFRGYGVLLVALVLLISYLLALVLLNDPYATKYNNPGELALQRLQKDWALPFSTRMSTRTSAEARRGESKHEIEQTKNGDHTQKDSTSREVDESSQKDMSEEEEKEEEDDYDKLWEQEKQASLAYVQSIKSFDRTLKFFHIPKTAGTAIEFAAGKRNIPWGSCLFHHRPRRGICRYPAGGFWASKIGWWHVPAQFFPLQNINPYQGAELFGVIRNPYDRMVSEFYYICTLRVTPWRPDQCDRTRLQDKDYMNKWLQTKLKPSSTSTTTTVTAAGGGEPYLADNGHFTPQYDFVFGPHQVRMLDHVLQMDDDNQLAETFRRLMEAYSLEKVQLEKRNALSAEARGKHNRDEQQEQQQQQQQLHLQVNDLDPQTFGAIHELYSEDFQLGYTAAYKKSTTE